MSVFHENMLIGASGQAPAATGISRSLRFNSSDSAYLSRTPSSAGNRKTWTWAGWVKRSALGVNTQNHHLMRVNANVETAVRIKDDDKIEFYTVVSGVYGFQMRSAQVLRDLSAWYHLVFSVDTTQATASNRAKIYVNGIQVTAWSTETYASQNYDTGFNQTVAHAIGASPSPSEYFSGYLADIYFIDGQALTPSSFTETDATTGQLVKKAYTGSFTGNSFYLTFEDNSAATATTLGKDSSGLGNNWTPNNLSVITGGPTSVASASGALPIYNTTDTYGAVKGTGTRTDSNSSSIVLAIPMDGANNGTTFTDESATIKGSGSTKTITRNGDTKTSTAQSKYYGSSGYFDGTGDFLQVASSADFAFGTDDFSVEFWYYHISGSDRGLFANNSGASIGVNFLVGASGPFRIYNGTSANNLVDFSASPVANTWQHIAVVRQGGIVTLYVNGVASGTANWTGVNAGNTATFSVGSAYGDARFANGYIQDFRVYKGVAKYTGNFNPPSSTQNPTIAAGNDSLVDVPTNGSEVDTGSGGQVRGNYATLNPLANGAGTLTNGNLDYLAATSNAWGTRYSTVGVSSGKWYAEFAGIAQTSGMGMMVGVSRSIQSGHVGSTSDGYGYRYAGDKYNSNSGSAYGASYTDNDVIGVALDLDNGTLVFYKNGASQGTAYSSLPSGTYFFGLSGYHTTTQAVANFGQRPFAYTAPSGFKALCTANLPAPLVTKPNTVMDVVLYTGTGSSLTLPYASSTPTSIAFTPDLVWIKGRSGATDHALYDAVRDVQKDLASNSTAAETTQSTGLTAFGTNTFTIGSLAKLNTSSATYAAWCWDAGSSTVTNTAGSISSQVRANATAGFSIVTYTANGTNGTSVGHGLGVKPALVIQKDRTSASDWLVLTQLIDGSDDYLLLNSTAAAATAAAGMTSTTFGSWDRTNGNSMVAYCFAPVVGYSSFGSYTGNGSSDGPFVYTGHRSRWILLKSTSTTGDWVILDAVRDSANAVANFLRPNLSDAEGNAGGLVDFCSNGFKLRNTFSNYNTNGTTYVWASFAESPFNYARAR